jgi:putative peptidoglycan binding protein
MKVLTKNRSRSLIPYSDVYDVQVFLQKEGYDKFIPSGVFQSKTQSALARFQKEHFISPSVGYLGSQTRLKINLLNFTKKEILGETAISLLGIDVSPLDRSIDDLACVESVDCVLEAALGKKYFNSLSTIDAGKIMKSSPLMFKPTNTPSKGTIIVSTTKGPKHGHIGIYKDSYKIMSNSSSTGIWSQNYNTDTWKNRYINLLGLTVEMYDII